MIYVYDILLNWSKDVVYDFFEWEKTDKLTHVKRIPLLRIERGIIKDILSSKVKINENFIKKITNPAEVYNIKKITKLPYTFLLSDTEIVLAIKCDKYGNIKLKSKLMLDEEEEILCISTRLNKIEFLYEKEKNVIHNTFLTRKESKVKAFLINEINSSYKVKNYDKIKYLYTEYFNESIKDEEKAYNKLMNTFKDEINSKHNELYDLLQLIGNKN